jgi:cephalosporin-C deacetylase-like acetyl esterase
LKDSLGFSEARLDLSKLVVSGHSFGGMSALGATCEDNRIKGVVALDPWFFPHYKELNA